MRRRSERPLPLGGLRGFEAAARRLSFKDAAEELHLTQSAMSRQIQALEEALGAKLFERKTRALALTETGRELYGVTHELLVRLDQAVRRIQARGGRRSVSVTTFASIVSMWLLPRLPEFNRMHPDVDVRIVAVDRLLDLESEGIDLAIRGFAPRNVPATAHELFREELFPVCSPSLLERVGRPLRGPEDLAAYVLLDFVAYGPVPFGSAYTWAHWFEAIGAPAVEPASKFSFSYFDQIIQAAVRGQGVALARSPLVADLIEEGDLVVPFRASKVTAYSICLVAARGAEQREEVRTFCEWVRAHADATNATFLRLTEQPDQRTAEKKPSAAVGRRRAAQKVK
jgi:LysR family glycine cleavage system transcriptional activator